MDFKQDDTFLNTNKTALNKCRPINVNQIPRNEKLGKLLLSSSSLGM